MIDQIDWYIWIFFSIPSFLVASTVHEYAHAYAAYKLGDMTAKMAGRLTLNPLAHIDPIGAIMMVIARIGWSKPVPINEYNFQNPVQGTALASLAGPASNILVAIVAAVFLRILGLENLLNEENTTNTFLAMIFLVLIVTNLSLAIFNLIPLPPLDGHKIVRAILPQSLRYYWEKLEDYGRWIIILIFLPFSPLSWLVSTILNTTIGFMLWFLVF